MQLTRESPVLQDDSSTPRQPTGPVLELRNVSKCFGAVQALREASLTVAAGEVVCLVGENGAGKSTMSAIAAGLLRPGTGTIHVLGEAYEFNGPADAERAGIRLAPQELLLCPNLTVAENVMLGAFPRRSSGLIDRRRMHQEARRRLHTLGLDDLDVSRRLEGLSVVERAFVQIARALTDDARILIADEPTAPMSATEASRLLLLLEAIKGRGVGVVYVSHRLDEVLRLADRTVVLRDGQVVDEFDRDNGSRSRLVSSMLGRKLDAQPPAVDFEGRKTEARLDVHELSVAGTFSEVSLTVESGQIVGLYGVAGSGREEIGPAIFGAVSVTSGQVLVSGRKVRRGHIRAAIESGLGYLPAERRSQGLLMERSVLENLSLASLGGFSTAGFLHKKSEQTRALEWIRQLRIKVPSAKTPVGRLSGGNQQKVLLARWIVRGAQVLVLDDPTRGVDVGSKAEIYDVLRELASDKGLALLIITSDIEEVTLLCTKVLVMRAGRLVAELDHPDQEQVAHHAYYSEAK